MPFDVVLAAGLPKDGYFMVVRQDNKWNFVHELIQEPISEVWYDAVRPFYEGFAAVQQDDKWNYIDETGEVLSDKWFDEARDFSNGMAVIRRKKVYSYVNNEGDVFGKYNAATSFQHGFASIVIHKRHYIINKEFEKIHGPLEYASNILVAGTAIVRDKEGQRVIRL